MTLTRGSFEGMQELLEEAGRSMLVLAPERSGTSMESVVATGAGGSHTVRVLSVWLSEEETALEGLAALSRAGPRRDYTTVTQSARPADALFNGSVRGRVPTIQISGHRVVIEREGRQGILDHLMPGGTPTQDLESVEIYARDVVMAAPVHLPGATVRIYAHSLTFEDRGCASHLRTTPFPMTDETGRGRRKAGSSSAAATSFSTWRR